MRITSIGVTYIRKFDLGDWNSARIECNLWASLDDGDDEAVVAEGLWTMAKANVKAQALPLVQRGSADVEEIFLGLPVKVRESLRTIENTMDDIATIAAPNGAITLRREQDGD